MSFFPLPESSPEDTTTQAHKRALFPHEDNPNAVPLGSPWISQEDAEMGEPISEDEEDRLSDLSGTHDNPGADVTLANSTLFIRNAIWWREMCKAVANGDPGRVWEILKLWIFTFAGSGNPYYSQYLLELYCNFKWEFSPKLRHAILMNWVVNLHGEPGMFIEMDLMQEHFNFWLEDMAQHKGKEFEEPFYRWVLSVNVHHFLRLKDEMENVVFLKARMKKHSAPHLNNELKEIMKHLREAEANCRRPGRHEGFEAVDDFTKGLEILKKEKIRNFVMRTTVYLNILGLHSGSAAELPTGDAADDGNDDDDTWGPSQREELPRHGPAVVPPPRMYVINEALCIEERQESNT